MRKNYIQGPGFVMVQPMSGSEIGGIAACWWRFMAYKDACPQGYPQGGRNIR